MTGRSGGAWARQAPAQAAFVIGERVIQLLPQVATIVLVSRLLGREFFGEYALVLTWSATFQLLAHFALTECLAREMAHQPEHGAAHFARGLVLAALLAAAATPLMAGAAWAFHYPAPVTRAIWLASALLLPANLLAACRAALLAHQRIEYMLAVALLEALFVLPTNLYWVLTRPGLSVLIGTIVIGRWLAAGACLLAVHRAVLRIRGPVGAEPLRRLWRTLLPYGIGSLLIFPNVRFDVLILSKLTAAAQVGLYLAGAKFADLFFVVPLSFFMVMLPRTAAALASTRPDLPGLERALGWYFALAIPGGMAVLVFARPLLLAVYGAEFVEATMLLQLQMVAFLLLALDVPLAMVIKAAGHQRVDVRFVGVSTASNVALCFVLIPRLGGLGAALALVGSVLAGASLRWLFLQRAVGGIRWRRVAGRPLALSILAGAACRLAAGSLAWPLVALGYGACYAALALWLLPAVSEGMRGRLRGSAAATRE